MNSLSAVSGYRISRAIFLFFGCLAPCLACSIDPVQEPVPLQAPLRPPQMQLGFVTYAPDPKAPVHLPANALGVLYSVGTSGAISQAKLAITEAGSATPLAMRVTRITALQRTLPAAESPDDSVSSSSVRPQEPDVLYRVGPAGGFRPGQRYVFTSGEGVRSTTHVVIDPVSIDMRSQVIRMAAIRPYRVLHREYFCSREMTWEWLMQPVAYSVPAALEPYRHLIFAFHAPVPDPVWRYTKSKVAEPDGEDLLAPYYTPQRFALHGGVFSADPEKITAATPRPIVRTAFLELEDQLRPMAVTLPAKPKAVPLHTSAEILEHAILSGDPVQLRDALVAAPRNPDENIRSGLDGALWNTGRRSGWHGALQKTWDRQRFHWRRQQLLRLIGAQLTHPDPRVRRALPHAVVGATGYEGFNWSEARRAIRILLAAMKDRDPVVRHMALDALMVVKARVVNHGLRVDMRVFAPAIPALIATMRHPDDMHRHNAAESLGSLYGISPQIIPAMLAAGESAGTPYKLWTLARDNPDVRQALQRASRSGTPGTRHAATMALDPPGLYEAPLPAPGPIRDHIFEMCEHEGPCVAGGN